MFHPSFHSRFHLKFHPRLHPRKLFLRSVAPILACVLLGGVGFASNSGSKSTKTTAPATRATVTPSEIAQAKAKGLVWVNTKSRIYHTGGRYYGKTKHGRFMSLADARKDGYRAAKR